MKPLHILTAAVLLWAKPCVAQDSASKVAIVLSPALFVPVTVAAQAGVQIKLGKKWSVLGEAAVPLFSPDQEQQVQDMRQRRMGVELKKRTRLREDRQNYFSLQTTYLFRRFTDSIGNYYRTESGAERYDQAEVSSPVLAIAFKAGSELYTNSKIYADVYFGIGPRFVLTRYKATNVFPIVPPEPADGTPVPEYAWRYNYTITRFHVTAGLRLGIRL